MSTPPIKVGNGPTCLCVAAVQMIFADSLTGNLEKIELAATRAVRAGADVVLFPECATTGYAFDFATLKPAELRRALRAVATIAARNSVHLLVGSPIFAGRRLFNGLVVFDRCGRLVHTYAKCQLTDADRSWFTPGNGVSLFSLDGVRATAIICHERRYPELVRLAVMAGAQVVFHPNAGMDTLEVSRAKRRGRDGMVVRAFENAVYYVFANSVGPQGGGKWSAGDSKIVAPDGAFLQLADNRREMIIVNELDLSLATRKYARESLQQPRILAAHWRRILPELRNECAKPIACSVAGTVRTSRISDKMDRGCTVPAADVEPFRRLVERYQRLLLTLIRNLTPQSNHLSTRLQASHDKPAISDEVADEIHVQARLVEVRHTDLGHGPMAPACGGRGPVPSRLRDRGLPSIRPTEQERPSRRHRDRVRDRLLRQAFWSIHDPRG